MKKISITDVLAYRQKFRFLTILAFLVLSFFLVQMIIKNPRTSLGANSCSGDICIIDTSMSLSATNTSYENSNLTVTGATTVLTLSNAHTFKSLTVQNGATITHDAAAAADNSSSIKQVNITTTGDITLSGGGNINVDGKGYPGGTAAHLDGYGPGPGHNLYVGDNNTDVTGGGGAHGGNGGGGHSVYHGGQTSAISLLYDDPLNPTDFGSGGGRAGSTHGYSDGAAGGGRIFLNCSHFNMTLDSFISAKGLSGTVVDGNIEGGGGAGGTISITYRIASVGLLASARGTNNGTIRYVGVSGTEDGSPTSDTNVNIEAMGGDNAAGGRILIKLLNSTVSIKKSLTAKNRNGANPANISFNPYALQLGDQITVNITLSNIIPGQSVTISDQPLVLPDNSHKCLPDTGQLTSGTVTGDALSNASFSYTCTVK